MQKKKAKGNVEWIDDELVGFRCECGKSLVVGIYKDSDYSCGNCGKKYTLEQSNVVYEIGLSTN